MSGEDEPGRRVDELRFYKISAGADRDRMCSAKEIAARYRTCSTT